MIDYLIHFFTYNKLYLLTGIVLLLLVLVPTKEKVSRDTKKALYLCVVIWIICFAYRINTGSDITRLFKSSNDFSTQQNSPGTWDSPFNKYYSNDAGRKPKD
jgi:hypothetical protein